VKLCIFVHSSPLKNNEVDKDGKNPSVSHFACYVRGLYKGSKLQDSEWPWGVRLDAHLEHVSR
jgi:hypothetical protein